jgi:hypothetical protein
MHYVKRNKPVLTLRITVLSVQKVWNQWELYWFAWYAPHIPLIFRAALPFVRIFLNTRIPGLTALTLTVYTWAFKNPQNSKFREVKVRWTRWPLHWPSPIQPVTVPVGSRLFGHPCNECRDISYSASCLFIADSLGDSLKIMHETATDVYKCLQSTV